jgi:2',3'-cyclic-nucleotide 2'-phosphodiesterase (5'-nucleotidase family)
MVQNTTNPVIFLEDGDQHMGSIWHTYYKGREAWEFLNVLCGPTANGGAGFAACVGGIGNHEFDGQYYNLLEYVRNINYQMVSSNIDDSCAQNAFGPMSAAELGSRIAKHTIITLPNPQQTKVGIVGYLTPETKSISSPPLCIDIPNEVAAVTAAVNALKAQGVKIIIALGHSGYAVDQTIAATIPDIDVVVGGEFNVMMNNPGTNV